MPRTARSRKLRALLLAAVSAALIGGPLAASPRRAVHKVSGAAVVGSDVTWIAPRRPPRISPDGEWIVWLQDAEVNDALALWAARRTGGAPKRLSGTLVPGDIFDYFLFTPDSKYVLYTAEQEGGDRLDLFSVPLLGTAADVVQISPTQVGPTHFIYRPTLTDDGQHVLFSTSEVVAGNTFFSAPVDGSSAAIGLDGPFTGSETISEFVVSGGTAVFARADLNAGRELWRVPVGGGPKVRLTPGFVDAAAEIGSVTLSPDGTRVAFFAEDSPWQFKRELWSAPVQGAAGSAVRLADIPVGSGDVSEFDFSPASSRIVFKADREVNEKRELYSVVADGSLPPVKLSTALIAEGDVRSYYISPDSSTVVYDADWSTDARNEVFSVPIGGPSAAGVRLNRALVAGESAIFVRVAFDDFVVYVVGNADQTVLHEVRATPYGGPASAGWQIQGAGAIDGGAPGAVLPDWTILTGDFVTPGDIGLFTTRTDGSSGNDNLLSPLWSDVALGLNSGVSPDSAEYVFLASLGGGSRHLYSTHVDGSQTFPVRVSAVPVSGGDVLDDVLGFGFTADGRGVLYVADAEVAGREELYIADGLVFAADFDEEQNTSEWSSTSP
ncbi:MAG: hypothetical protein ABI639_06410 [Thermoanaerobaculia bacterium]